MEEDAWFLRRDNKDQLILGKYFFGSLFYLLCDLLPVRMQGTVSWQYQRGSISVAVSACQRGSGRQCKAVPVRRDSNDEEFFDVCLIM